MIKTPLSTAIGGVGFYTKNTLVIGGQKSEQPFDPASLFLNGEQGLWLDPNDLSNMFQDAAGTIPVTGVGQPVGLILDKSGRGNHAIQPDSAKRPNLIKKGVWQGDGIDDFMYIASVLQMTEYTVVSRTYAPKSSAKNNILVATGVGSYPYRSKDKVVIQGTDLGREAVINELDTVALTYANGITRIRTSVDDKSYAVPTSWLSGSIPIHIGIFSPTGSSKSSAEYGGMLVINRQLSDSEVSNLFKFMKSKWPTI